MGRCYDDSAEYEAQAAILAEQDAYRAEQEAEAAKQEYLASQEPPDPSDMDDTIDH